MTSNPFYGCAMRLGSELMYPMKRSMSWAHLESLFENYLLAHDINEASVNHEMGLFSQLFRAQEQRYFYTLSLHGGISAYVDSQCRASSFSYGYSMN